MDGEVDPAVPPPGGDWAEWIGLSNLQLCLSDPQVMYNRCYSEVVPLLEEKFPTILINFVWAKKWVNSRKEETPIHPANIEEFVLSSLLA